MPPATDDDRWSAYVDARLNPAETLVVEQQLAAEPEAKEDYERLVAVVSALRRLRYGEPQPAPEFWADAFARLRAEVHAHPPRPTAVQQVGRALPLVALCLVVAGVATASALWLLPAGGCAIVAALLRRLA